MRILGKVAVGALACILGFGSIAFAQPTPRQEVRLERQVQARLDEAIRTGNVQAINTIIGEFSKDAAVTAEIATILYASAQATSAGGNSTGGALLAALAVSTGGLSGAQALSAQNMVLGNPTVLALVTNANAPNTGGITSALLTSSGTIVASNTPASNPNQSNCTTSC